MYTSYFEIITSIYFLCDQVMYKIVCKFLFPYPEYIFSGPFVEMIKEMIVNIKQYSGTKWYQYCEFNKNVSELYKNLNTVLC